MRAIVTFMDAQPVIAACADGCGKERGANPEECRCPTAAPEPAMRPARPQELRWAPAGRASSAAWCSIEGAINRRVNRPLLNSPSRQIPQRNIPTPTPRSLMDAPGKQYWPEQTSVCPRDPRMQRIRPNSHDVLNHKRASDVRTCPKPLSGRDQVTIPADIRRAVRLCAGERVVITQLEDGTIAFRATRRSILELRAGC